MYSLALRSLVLGFVLPLVHLPVLGVRGQSTITISPFTPPYSVPVVQDNFIGVSLEFNVLDVLGKRSE